MSTSPSPAILLLALIVIQVFFGINYIVSKMMVEVFPPLVWAGIRCSAAVILLIALALALERPRPHGWKFFGPAIGFSLLAIVFNQAFFLVGLHYTTSTNSAILNTLIPVFTLAVVVLRGQEKMSVRKAFSFVAAFAGVLVLLRAERFVFSSDTLRGDVFTMLNSLSYGLYLAYSKRFIEKYDRIWITVWLFFFGSIGLNLMAIPDWTHFHPPPMTPTLWAAAAFVVLGGTFLTYLLTNVVLAHVEASKVALFVYIQPVVASCLAWCCRGEQMTARTLLGSAFIFLGVYLAGERREERLSVVPSP